jgi:hypothetical protein
MARYCDREKVYGPKSSLSLNKQPHQEKEVKTISEDEKP